MYSACLFCHSRFPHNELIEHFPVGRRLAFDAGKGRLWVVCARCAGWNLTPLEERWEAIEECERLYRDTRIRASTDQIGLARLREGLELVRIGTPLRPEFAAWRYGERFRRRRRQMYVTGGITAGIIAATAAATALLNAPGLYVFGPAYGFIRDRLQRNTEVGQARQFLARTVAYGSRDRALDGPRQRFDNLRIHGHVEYEVLLRPTPDEQGWGLRIAGPERPIDFVGREALRVAHIILPAANAHGASARDLDRAVLAIERAGDPRTYFRVAMRQVRLEGRLYSAVESYPSAVRLALEMAAAEEAERRAIEGELAELQRAWREAEEIAAIADDLLVPEHVEVWLARQRSLASGSSG